MSKKKETEIKEKAIELGFKSDTSYLTKYSYSLPFGLKNYLTINFLYTNPIVLDIENDSDIIEIRPIESPEDLENLLNAICPEKYRLPFD